MPPDQIPTCPRRVVGFAECFSGEDATEKRVFGMDWQFQTNVVPMSLPVSGGPCAVLRLRSPPASPGFSAFFFLINPEQDH
jgi:hypothetical protein